MKVSDFKSEFTEFENAMNTMYSLRREIETDSTDENLLKARKEKDEANRKYSAALNEVVLNDKEYLQLQKECVRSAVRTFSRNRKDSGFVSWFNDNEKDTKLPIIDSTQRLTAFVVNAYKDYYGGKRKAVNKKNLALSREEKIKLLQERLKTLQAEEEE